MISITEILFGIFSIGALISGFLVISSTNPVHSIFSLVLAFANCCFLLILLGVEFLAFLFMIVYVGAIAILFLFVVMMLNIRLVEIMDNATRYVPAGFIIGMIFLLQLLIITDQQFINSNETSIWYNALDIINASPNHNQLYDWINTTLIGNYLYTEGWIYFLVSSLVLLVSMIGAIVLTLHHEKGIKRQDIFSQIIVDPASEIKKIN